MKAVCRALNTTFFKIGDTFFENVFGPYDLQRTAGDIGILENLTDAFYVDYTITQRDRRKSDPIPLACSIVFQHWQTAQSVKILQYSICNSFQIKFLKKYLL